MAGLKLECACAWFALAVVGCASPVLESVRHAHSADARTRAVTDADAEVDADADAAGPPAEDSGPPTNGYWAGIRRSFARAPSGNVAAVSCHNCYEMHRATSAENLAATLDRLHAAQHDGADLLELDLRSEAGIWYVAHDDDGSTDKALLDELLPDQALLDGDQLLYLELKEDNAPDRDALARLLQTLRDHGYGVEGRDVVLRAFNMRIENLRTLRELLADGTIDEAAASHFRVQVLFALAEAEDPAIDGSVDAAASEGFDGVEFNHTSTRVLDLLARARGLGLGTNVWTFGRDEGTALCTQFRDVSDALTTDSPLAECRAAVQMR